MVLLGQMEGDQPHIRHFTFEMGHPITILNIGVFTKMDLVT